MKNAMLALSNVMVIGDKRKYLTMLVSLKSEIDPETAIPTDKMAADRCGLCVVGVRVRVRIRVRVRVMDYTCLQICMSAYLNTYNP